MAYTHCRQQGFVKQGGVMSRIAGIHCTLRLSVYW